MERLISLFAKELAGPYLWVDRYLGARTLEEHTAKTITDIAALKRELSKTRKRGYSTDDEEFMDNMVAIAVPILDDQGRLVSTLSAHAPMQRHDLDALVANLDMLKGAAQQLSELLQR